MKLHEYNEMMSYVLRRPMSMGGRVNLKYGGTFKEYINREDKYEDLSFEEWLREDKAEGGRIGFKSGTPFQITDEVLKKIDDLIKETNLDLKTIGKQIGFGTDKKPMDSNSKVFQEYIKKYGKPSDARLQTRGVPLSPDKGLGKKIIKAYDKQIKNFGKPNISQIAKEVYGAGVKDLDSARAQVRSVLGKFRDYQGKANIPIDKKDLTPEQIKSKARVKKLKPVDNPTITKFMAGPQDSGFQYHHMDATKTSMVTLNNVVYLPDEVNNYIQKYEGPITQRKKEIAKLNKNKPKGYKKQIDAKLNQIRNTIAKADIDLDKAGYSAYKGVIEVDTIDVNGKPLKIGGGSALRLGEGLAEELGLDPNKPLKQFTPEEQIKLTEAKKALIKKSSINKPKATGFAKPGGPTLGANLIPTDADSKNIAKKLASFGFKCSAAEGGACDNPMNYLDDIKKQQTIAKGSGNAAANAVKKLSAGKTVLREFIGPLALTFELAAAVPITYLGYKAGLPPARIVADATYGLFGDTEKARLKKVAAEQNIDTSEIQKSLDFEKASGAMQTLAQQEGEFRGPDDEMLFPQQYEKGEEDFYKSVGAFTDEEGNISKDVYKQYGSQLQGLRDYIAKLDADTAAERASKVADIGGIADYLEPSTRMNFSEGSPKDLSRRRFIKIMAGIASLPIVGKFFPGFKAAKSAKVVKLANTSTAMPEWFPDFVDKAFARGVGKKIDADITEVEIPELPDVKLTKHDDGRVFVEGRNEYNEGYQIEYKPPGYEVIDEKTGKAVKTPGEFDAVEGRHVALGPEDYDVDPFYADDLDELTTIDIADMEKYATGKVTKTVKDAFGTDTGLKKGVRNYDMAVGTAENTADVLRDADLLDEID